jgi:AraC-like DNA-binding protein
MVLMSNADVGDMTLASNTRFTTFRIPRAAIAPLVPDIGSMIARRVPASTPALQLLTRYLDIFREVEALASPRLQHLAVTHVYDLLALALGVTHDAAAVAKERGLRAARLHAIKAEIVAQAGGDLSIDAVAAAQGVTRRYVQMLFEEDATTFTQFVLDQRLANAGRMLRNARLARHTPSRRSPSRPASATCPISTARSGDGSAARHRNYAPMRRKQSAAPRPGPPAGKPPWRIGRHDRMSVRCGLGAARSVPRRFVSRIVPQRRRHQQADSRDDGEQADAESHDQHGGADHEAGAGLTDDPLIEQNGASQQE